MTILYAITRLIIDTLGLSLGMRRVIRLHLKTQNHLRETR